jgi:hypothetical protein
MSPSKQIVTPAAILTMIFVGGASFLWLIWPSRLGVSPIWGVVVVGVSLYAVYAVISLQALSQTAATMEGNLLFVRRGDKEVGTVDLAQPFDARCIFSGPNVAHYRVRQNRQVVEFVVPMTSDGRLVQEGLKLPWPPKLSS